MRCVDGNRGEGRAYDPDAHLGDDAGAFVADVSIDITLEYIMCQSKGRGRVIYRVRNYIL